jgi:hypothetical protein
MSTTTGKREEFKQQEAFKNPKRLGVLSYVKAASGQRETVLAAVKLQSLARVVIAKECVASLKNNAATMIQALYRGSNQMSEYKSDLQSTIKAQAAVRGFIQRQKDQKDNGSAVTIQAAIRGWSTRKNLLPVMHPAVPKGCGCIPF